MASQLTRPGRKRSNESYLCLIRGKDEQNDGELQTIDKVEVRKKERKEVTRKQETGLDYEPPGKCSTIRSGEGREGESENTRRREMNATVEAYHERETTIRAFSW